MKMFFSLASSDDFEAALDKTFKQLEEIPVDELFRIAEERSNGDVACFVEACSQPLDEPIGFEDLHWKESTASTFFLSFSSNQFEQLTRHHTAMWQKAFTQYETAISARDTYQSGNSRVPEGTRPVEESTIDLYGEENFLLAA